MLRLVLLLFVCLPTVLSAQNNESDLRLRLLRKSLYLRCLCREDKLRFDSAGYMVSTSGLTTFTASGIEIDSVKLEPQQLTLRGHRVGLEFVHDTPKRVLLRSRYGSTEEMHLEVKAPASGDYTEALDVMFTENLGDLETSLPSYWRPFAREHLVSYPPSVITAPAASAPKLEKIGGLVKPPRLVKSSEPSYTLWAAALGYHATVLVNFYVDNTGTPRNIHVLRAAGLGLDEAAVAAVNTYRFEPSKMDGVPVAVEINVEVNFQM